MTIINSTRIEHGDDSIVVASHEDATVSLFCSDSGNDAGNGQSYLSLPYAKALAVFDALGRALDDCRNQRIRIETERAEALREDRDERAPA